MLEEYEEHCINEHNGYGVGVWIEWENEYGQKTITVTDGVCKYCGVGEKPYKAYLKTKEDAKK